MVLVLARTIPARTEIAVCGSVRGNVREELDLARKAARANAGRPRSTASAGTQFAKDFGDIAVMDSGGGVVERRNPFNLAGTTISFVPNGTGYRFSTSAAEWDSQAAADGMTLSGIGDDDFRLVSLPFPVRFYGKTFDQAFIHSDGNVTFEQPDAASTARSLGRMTAGPPRLGPLFSDLDPSRGGEIRVYAGPDRFVVTWDRVPEYASIGSGPRQTLQLTLAADGAIRFTLQQIEVSEAVVGVAPGRLSGGTTLVSLRSGGGEETYNGAVAERFGNSESLDATRVAQRFFETHEDAYDYLVVFNTLGLPAASGALAVEMTVRGRAQGIGDEPVDSGFEFGSPRRMQALMSMGPLSQYPKDPYSPVGSRGRITGDNTMTILGHEAGHLYLALASTREPNDPAARPMLGTQNAHWSFNFNSEASLLEGNRIADFGPDTPPRFLTIGTVEGYAPLDQYLMGWRAPEEVPPTFLVRPSSLSPTAFPQVGVRFSGTRNEIRVEDVIAAEGERVPSHRVSQRKYRFAFVLIVPEGSEPAAEDLSQLERYRREFEPYFRRASGERAAADLRLRKALAVSAWPATGLIQGREGRIVIRTERPVPTDLVLKLTAEGGVELPAEVTIPGGASEVSVPALGSAAGVWDLTVDAGEEFEVVSARVPVKASAGELRLIVHYAAGPLVLRVADSDETPYSNMPIHVTGTGTLELLSGGKTDENGLAWFVWLPGTEGEQSLTAEIEGAPRTRLIIRP